MIQLSLVDEMMYNLKDEETATGLWSRLETLYMTTSLSNKLYLKEPTCATHEQRDNSVGAFKLLQQGHH